MMINKLINEIKKKKELRNVDSTFIRNIIEKDYEKNKEKLISHSHPKKSKEFKGIVKNARRVLHEVYGVFSTNLVKRQNLLKKIKKDPGNRELHYSLLETHRSSRERLPFYPEVYEKILNKNDKVILDIGCGLNPVSWIFMKNKPKKYIAIELTEGDCRYLNRYFKVSGLDGKAIRKDLLNIDKFPKADVCFIFKVLDSLEQIKINISKDILQKLNCKKIVVSFPSRTLSGKGKIRDRKWFERLLKDFEKFEIENEVFYIINKKKVY